MTGNPSLATDAQPRTLTARSITRRRAAIVSLVLLVVILVLTVVGVSNGSFSIEPSRILATLFGQGERAEEFVLFRLRLPASVLGILVGAAFGVAGALFQTLLRNPLASPDIIGISGGASVAAAFGILILGVSGAMVSLLAFVGAVIVALAIYSLSYRGGITGMRFVLIGVGFAFMAQSVLGYLLSRGDVREASQALTWMVGGLGGADWQGIAVLAIALAVLLPLVAVLAPQLSMMQLGDDVAASLGVSVHRTRQGVLAVAVAMTAVAVAFAGPIAFVAFVSAPIARRLVGGGALALVPSALVGATVVLTADLLGTYLIPGASVPAGVITAIIGAPYLLWLIAASSRQSRAA
ncbi:FecCD family ABC transporter permease [Salinibacterium hongtaonis]|uniref:FecCD family ABC transporter permease n=1 Tax=Homoserinimonas hongtaonis TaxID=2079791 RepID=UPI000D36A31D|nr:iron ABC transporter permease [Salinibacterium hongtaonis]AWB89644.1 iron ABC transporter [Salinibacterium hongtaonis]